MKLVNFLISIFIVIVSVESSYAGCKEHYRFHLRNQGTHDAIERDINAICSNADVWQAEERTKRLSAELHARNKVVERYLDKVSLLRDYVVESWNKLNPHLIQIRNCKGSEEVMVRCLEGIAEARLLIMERKKKIQGFHASIQKMAGTASKELRAGVKAYVDSSLIAFEEIEEKLKGFGVFTVPRRFYGTGKEREIIDKLAIRRRN